MVLNLVGRHLAKMRTTRAIRTQTKIKELGIGKACQVLQHIRLYHIVTDYEQRMATSRLCTGIEVENSLPKLSHFFSENLFNLNGPNICILHVFLRLDSCYDGRQTVNRAINAPQMVAAENDFAATDFGDTFVRRLELAVVLVTLSLDSRYVIT